MGCDRIEVGGGISVTLFLVGKDRSIDDVGLATGVVFGRVGAACENTSSASTAVTLLLMSCFGSAAGTVWPNSNLAPRSCRSENSSRDGNLEASSSAAAALAVAEFESSAAKGSLLVPLDPAGVTLAETGSN